MNDPEPDHCRDLSTLRHLLDVLPHALAALGRLHAVDYPGATEAYEATAPQAAWADALEDLLAAGGDEGALEDLRWSRAGVPVALVPHMIHDAYDVPDAERITAAWERFRTRGRQGQPG